MRVMRSSLWASARDVRHPVQRDDESGGGDAENRQRENHLKEKESACGRDGRGSFIGLPAGFRGWWR